jgi:hypothetical protein
MLYIPIEEVEDAKGVIRSHKFKNDRQYNCYIRNDKKINNEQQKITQKIRNGATRSPIEKQIENKTLRRFRKNSFRQISNVEFLIYILNI